MVIKWGRSRLILTETLAGKSLRHRFDSTWERLHVKRLPKCEVRTILGAALMVIISYAVPTATLGYEPPGPWVVLFDNNSTTITDEGRSAIESFFAAIPERNQKVIVTCNTDRVGSAAYNLALSERRCAVVRDSLILSGYRRDLIIVWPRGEQLTPVPTRDEVKEMANRAVRIDLCKLYLTHSPERGVPSVRDTVAELGCD
jgi:hypothetical protein